MTAPHAATAEGHMFLGMSRTFSQTVDICCDLFNRPVLGDLRESEDHTVIAAGNPVHPDKGAGIDM